MNSFYTGTHTKQKQTLNYLFKSLNTFHVSAVFLTQMRHLKQHLKNTGLSNMWMLGKKIEQLLVEENEKHNFFWSW